MKKRKFNDLLLLPLACLPHGFFALWADHAWHMPLMYLLLLFPIGLCWRWERKNYGRLVILGNAVSAALSGLLTFLLLRAQNAYFKPFGAMGMFALLTGLSWLAQYMIWLRKRAKTPAQSLFLAIGLTTLLLLSGVFLLLFWNAWQIGAF